MGCGLNLNAAPVAVILLGTHRDRVGPVSVCTPTRLQGMRLKVEKQIIFRNIYCFMFFFFKFLIFYAFDNDVIFMAKGKC